MDRPKKLVLIGLDAPIVPRMLDLAERGEMPAVAQLVRSGTVAANCVVPFPTITPPNWMTIVTGAWPGTHQITCFNAHNPGDPLDRTHAAFDVRECQAEILWNKAAEVGKKSFVLNYPTTWPPQLRLGYQIGGAGLSVNEWRFGSSGDFHYYCTLADEQLFSTEDYPEASKVGLKKASGWKGGQGLEADLQLLFRKAESAVRSMRWHMLVEATSGKGYDRVTLSKSKDPVDSLAVLHQGEWSEILVEEFETEKGKRSAAYAVKLLELSSSGSTLKLYVTPICSLDGWSHPPELAMEIPLDHGLPLPAPCFESLNLEWVDTQTYLEIVEMHNNWLAGAASYVMQNKEWDLFFMQNHVPDYAYHSFSTQIDPATNPDRESRNRFESAEVGFYRSLDKMISRIVASAGEDPLVILVSDHGAKASGARVNVGLILEEAGLLFYSDVDGEPRRRVDWSRTRAIPQRSCYVYVNLKGRDPDGIVEHEDYKSVVDSVISALYDYTDPSTGRKPISLALRREDARILGLYGRRIGDVVYAIAPEFGGQHGHHLPTARFGIGSLEGLLIMSGPGIRRGFILERTAWLTDIVPTICYLMELPIPAHAEGSILYQALEDPDINLSEKQRLAKNLERMKRAYEARRQLTHTYSCPG